MTVVTAAMAKAAVMYDGSDGYDGGDGHVSIDIGVGYHCGGC